MTPSAALGVINNELELQADLTARGDEVKCYRPGDDGGLDKTYLDAADCRVLSEAFGVLAAALSESPARGEP